MCMKTLLVGKSINQSKKNVPVALLLAQRTRWCHGNSRAAWGKKKKKAIPLGLEAFLYLPKLYSSITR